VDPYNVDELAEAMRTVLVDQPLRERLIASGRIRAEEFSWEEAVSQIHATYMEALE
jgi:glycosyltransferase involved in cell wall biosynthesis